MHKTLLALAGSLLVAQAAVAQDAKPLTYVSTVKPPAGLELVVNGSFEADRISAGSWVTKSSLTGWSGGSGGIELRNGVAGNAYDGLQYVELDTSRNSAIYQDLLGSTTAVTGDVRLSFWYSARPGTTSQTNGVKFGFGNDLVTLAVPGNTTADNVWRRWEGTFNLKGNDVLSFLALGTSDSYGTAIDRISVSAVPEASTWAQLALGLSAAVWVGARSRKKAS